jgi:23S rRNA-/tRNA-specific pseudouridylate synthase
VFIDRDLVVVNKPTMMLTFDQHRLENDTLEFRVRGTIQRLRKGRASEPVYPIYSVDERASGLVMFARSPEMQKVMQEQWSQGLMRRTVCAVVAGAPETQKVETLLVHDRGDGYRGSLPSTVRKAPNAQKAITDVRMLQDEEKFSCVWCRALSNRPHQVRIHLSELESPILGDYVYQKAAENNGVEPFWRKLPKVHRMMLHVTDLRFRHPRSEMMVQVRGGLPKDFKRVLKELGLDEVTLPQPESLPNSELKAMRRREEEERRAAERAAEEERRNRVLPPWLARKRGYVAQERPQQEESSDSSQASSQKGRSGGTQPSRSNSNDSRPNNRSRNHSGGGRGRNNSGGGRSGGASQDRGRQNNRSQNNDSNGGRSGGSNHSSRSGGGHSSGSHSGGGRGRNNSGGGGRSGGNNGGRSGGGRSGGGRSGGGYSSGGRSGGGRSGGGQQRQGSGGRNNSSRSGGSRRKK